MFSDHGLRVKRLVGETSAKQFERKSGGINSCLDVIVKQTSMLMFTLGKIHKPRRVIHINANVILHMPPT